MAIDHSRLRMFLKMQRRYAFKGKILTIGVQDIMASHEDIASLLRKENFPYKEIPLSERKYRRSKGQKVFEKFFNVKNPMHMDDLFKMLNFQSVGSLDAFDNDNPAIVHDLNKPIPKEYYQKYDIVVDIGCAEHVFDVKQVMQNLSNMVKVGGVLYLYLPMLGWHNECFYNFQPPLFFDVFSANGYEDMVLYLNYYPKYFLRDKSKTKWVEYKYGDRAKFRKFFHYTHLLFIARKRHHVDNFVSPLMQYYLNWFQQSNAQKGKVKNESHYMIDNMPSVVVKFFPLLIPVFKILPNMMRALITDSLIDIKNMKKLSKRERLRI